MPDATLYANVDGMVGRSGSNWSDTLTGSGTINAGIATNSSVGIYSRVTGGRGGTTYLNYRSFFAFDCSSASGTVDSATLKVYCDNIGSVGPPSTLRLTGASSLSTAIDNGDYGNVYSSGTTWFDDYSSFVTISTTAGYHSFVLNSDGISALQTAIGSGTFTCALVSNAFDYGGTTPSTGGTYTRITVYYSEYAGTSRDPKLEIDYTTAVTNNAILFGTSF